ncbi:unnamed protein product [Lactuca virosa]|uniref:Uncharacterized protein n=1 Tax=Lactuca virosa TaxID=75947 RepID=A0AAU9PS89_9ASTR|nr:unnamed protein product [Lactuca virosa]
METCLWTKEEHFLLSPRLFIHLYTRKGPWFGMSNVSYLNKYRTINEHGDNPIDCSYSTSISSFSHLNTKPMNSAGPAS